VAPESAWAPPRDTARTALGEGATIDLMADI
jgi:hypothetical protein